MTEKNLPTPPAETPSAPQDGKSEPQPNVLIDVYEIHAKRSGADFTVVRHGELNTLRDVIWIALDDLEDGESIKITYRKYTQEQMDEVSEND